MGPLQDKSTDSPQLTRPFVHLNLRINPFGEIGLEHRAELAVVDIQSLIRPLTEPGFAVQFMGGKGRGKTTHVLTLLAHFPDAAYIHLPEGWHGEIPHSHPAFIDEIQRVPRRQRREVFARPVSFVLGTHVNYESELRRAGLQCCTIHPGDLLNAERLGTIIDRRIEWARRGPGPVPGVRAKTIDQLLIEFGSDVRAIEGQLYEWFQELDCVKDV